MRYFALTLLFLTSATHAAEEPARPLGVPGNIVAVPVASPGEVFVPPAIVEIPEDKHGDMVKLGRNIVVNTQHYARRFTGNGLTCANCHLSEGRKPDAAPLWAAFLTYPRLVGKEVQTFEQRVQDCFRLELDGMGPPLDSPEMQGLVAYAQWLASGAPARVNLPGRGFPVFVLPPGISSARGAQIYTAQCALCHGADGRGRAHAKAKGYQFPPLWGNDSYTAGSALLAPDKAAAFIQANMPPGRANALSDREAADVAAFLAAQDRPADPRLGWFARLKRWFDARTERVS